MKVNLEGFIAFPKFQTLEKLDLRSSLPDFRDLQKKSPIISGSGLSLFPDVIAI